MKLWTVRPISGLDVTVLATTLDEALAKFRKQEGDIRLDRIWLTAEVNIVS